MASTSTAAVLVATCSQSDVNAEGQCAHITWAQQPAASVFPPLTAVQGVHISGAIAACWAIGAVVRIIRKQIGV